MHKTKRFDVCRFDTLDAIFEKNKMKRTWKNEIRPSLRKHAVSDLFDYQDFHKNIDQHLDELRSKILQGSYSPRLPLYYKEEKKFGVSRVLVLPSPHDSLVLQSLTNELVVDLSKVAPVKSTYFSLLRDKKLPMMHEVSIDLPVSIATDSSKWKKYKTDVYGFAQNTKYLVCTDISNFFDSIQFRDLRHVVSHWFQKREVELDLIFKILESLNLTPDFLPTRTKGLPTIDIDAPRILAHSYLFEIDRVMAKLTANCYGRWMDDIVFGANSFNEAKKILGNLSEIARSRGLHLNLQKTEIFESKQAIISMMYKENVYIDSIEKDIKLNKITLSKKQTFKKKAEGHLNMRPENRARIWDKVMKRYIRNSIQLHPKLVVENLSDIFLNHPTLRASVIFSNSEIGLANNTFTEIGKIIRSPYFSEDAALIYLTDMLCGLNASGTRKEVSIHQQFLRKLQTMDSEIGIYSHLMYLILSSNKRGLKKFVRDKTAEVSRDSFLARQLMAALPLLYIYDKRFVDDHLRAEALRNSSIGALSKDIQKLLDGNFDVAEEAKYLFHNLNGKPLKFSKLVRLITCLISKSENSELLFQKSIDSLASGKQLHIVLSYLEK